MTTQLYNSVTNTNTNTFKCDRVINKKICGFPSVESIERPFWLNPRCKNCVNSCSFVDINGNTCQEKVDKNDYCNFHNDIVWQLEEYDYWKQTIEFHKKYVYCGKHWDKADERGPIYIYHYISRDRIGSKSIEDFDEWDYDIEISVGHKLRIICGPRVEVKISDKYPEDYKQQLEKKALVKLESE